MCSRNPLFFLRQEVRDGSLTRIRDLTSRLLTRAALSTAPRLHYYRHLWHRARCILLTPVANSLSMRSTSEPRVLAKPESLDEDYLPDLLHARATEIEEITNSLSPAAKGRRPINLWLYGSPGTGKTLTARFVLRKLESEGVRGVYVNCWEHPSLYSVVENITDQLRILGADQQRTTVKLQRLARHLADRPFLIVLDELDQAPPSERANILYGLYNLGKTGLVCIAASREPLHDLDDRIKSRLSPREVSFAPYSRQQVLDILKNRADLALATGSWKQGTLERIAQLSGGDARVALHTLRHAAELAESENSSGIHARHVDLGFSRARVVRSTYVLRKLTADHQLLHDIIRKRKEILSGDLWRAYLKRCRRLGRRSIAVRTFSDYVNSLRDAKLIEVERASVKGQVRLLRVLET